MIELAALNSWSKEVAREAFLRCCGARRWAERMAARRPFASEQALRDLARQTWRELTHTDMLEAFASHPKIGDLEALRRKFASTAALAAGEQAGVVGASEATVKALAEGNRRYVARFGYIFIVCARGKGAAEMLALLNERLNHAPEEELRIAAAEQEKILLLRLEQMTP
jgi:2-oxo-4-hydroxy-4-carboxy-5-ureidoimidazoline decarboxylase